MQRGSLRAGDDRAETLTGIETCLPAICGAGERATIGLKPLQGLKPVTWAIAWECAAGDDRAETLTGIETTFHEGIDLNAPMRRSG